MSNDWQPISTCIRIPGKEILATDYDSIEIIHWAPVGKNPVWEDRYCDPYFPSLWQELPDVPPLPEEP